MKELLDSKGYYPDNAIADFSTVPVIAQRIKEICENELDSIIENILLGDVSKKGRYLKSIQCYEEEIYASQKMNYAIWELRQTPLIIRHRTFEDSMFYFRKFVKERKDWLCGTIASWSGDGMIKKVKMELDLPLTGMPLELNAKLPDKWGSAELESVEFIEQDVYYERDVEYHCIITLASLSEGGFLEDVSLELNVGTVRSVSIEDGKKASFEVDLGVPKVVNTVKDGINYEAVYNKEYYLAHYPEAAQQAGMEDEDVLSYFLTEGMAKEHRGCEDFDVKVYIARYPIFGGMEYADIYWHYMNEGIAQGWSGKL